MDVIERGPRKANFRDLSGTVNSHGVDVLRLLGWGKKADGSVSPICVYECRCPLCGNTMKVWGNLVARTRHCGCAAHQARLQRHEMRPIRQYWFRSKNTLLCQEWQDYQVFLADVRQMQPHEILIHKDRTESRVGSPDDRLGPQTYVRLMPSPSRPIHDSSPVWVVSHPEAGMDPRLCTASGVASLLRITRQAAHQHKPETLTTKLLAAGFTVQTIAQWAELNPDQILYALGGGPLIR